jgi:hypothetical protein
MLDKKPGAKAVVLTQPETGEECGHAFKVGTEIELTRKLPLLGSTYYEFTDGKIVQVVLEKFIRWL